MQGSSLRNRFDRRVGHPSTDAEETKNPFLDCRDRLTSANPITAADDPDLVADTSSTGCGSENIVAITMELTDCDRVHTQICTEDSAASWNLSQHQRLPPLPVERVFGELEEEEVDSREESPTIQNPIRRSCLSNAVPIERQPASLSSSSIWKPRSKLTLSAFRRPEDTIRLTQSDPSRRLDAEYDLHGTGGSGVLGHGAYSTVRLAIRKKDRVQVAVKIISKHEALRSRRLRRVHTNADSRYYLEEWEILRRLHDHPHVITLLDVFETAEEIQLVTEYCPGGELFDAIQKKQRRNRRSGNSAGSSSESQAAQITSQILQALVDVHAAGIVHRDVKPENILLAKPQNGESVHVKLCDFGVARPLMRQVQDTDDSDGATASVCISCDGEMSPLTPGSRSRSFSTIGSDYYAAPELTYGGSYDTAVDIYSLGVTLYILLCGFPPVFASSLMTSASAMTVTQEDDSDDDEGFEEVLFPDAYWSTVSDGAKAMLKRMLHPNASLRVNAVEALQDPWVKQSLTSPPSPKQQDAMQPQSPPDLDLVRNQLYKSMESLPEEALRSPPASSTVRCEKRGHSSAPMLATTAPLLEAKTPPRKRQRGSLPSGGYYSTPNRRRMERRASTTALMALADLYRGVATPSVLAAAAAAAASNGNHGASPASPPTKKDSVDNSFTATTSPVAALSF